MGIEMAETGGKRTVPLHQRDVTANSSTRQCGIQFDKGSPKHIQMSTKLGSRFDDTGIRFNAFARQLKTRHGRDRLHLQAIKNLTQLLRGFVPALAAVGDDYRGLPRPFRIEMIESIFQRCR